MPLSSNTAIALPTLPIPVSSIPRPQVNCRIEIFSGQRIVTFSPYRRKRNCLTNSVSSDGNNSINVDIPFPSDYSELLDQAKMAAELAVKDGRKLMEIEFPTAGLDSVPGDGEGGIEMTGSMRLIREFCDLFVTPEKVTRTRIIWSSVEKDAEVMRLPTEDLPFGKKKLFLLVNPTVRKKLFVPGLEVPTADIKVKMADRVKPEDEMFLVAYPYFNVNEMLVVEELYKEAVFNTARKLIIFNGELDRIRCYPGSWKVLKKVSNKYICLHQQEVMPSLKEVALDILPSA
ncbi:DUF1995 domain-containing protein [Citrus sinensis]|uniref:DUF1995 domain-containing protein n=1 Tax=Citrus sinensis TaxID=2711 RepID=A0ACB8KFE6_CITSI|nr:DUF1995 domain-containing protein [Citrus sinensis]